MNKYKISPGLVGIILVASLFSGWSTLLIVAAIILVFCEIDEKVRGMMIRVISFFVGYYLLSLAWSLIYDGVFLVSDSFKSLIEIINSYLSYDNLIDVTKIYTYVFNPITKIVEIMDSVISYLLMFAKYGFILLIISNKPMKNSPITNKINGFVNNVMNFINSIDFPIPQQQTPQQQYQQMPQQYPQQPNNFQM